MFTLIAWSFAWLHLVVAGIKRTRVHAVSPATRAAA
jgi:hypothetical protein